MAVESHVLQGVKMQGIGTPPKFHDAAEQDEIGFQKVKLLLSEPLSIGVLYETPSNSL